MTEIIYGERKTYLVQTLLRIMIGGMNFSGTASEMVDDHPLGANLEAFHLSPRFWQLKNYAEDHVDQAKELVDDTAQWNRVSEAHDIHPEEGGTHPRTNVA